MKKILLFLSFALWCFSTYSQNISASVITDSVYLSNPDIYLSQINTSNVNTGVLIDRDIYSSLLLNINGYDKVTTITYKEWKDIYKNFSATNYDSLAILKLDTIRYFKDLIYQNEKCFPVGIIDCKFNRIKQSAIDNQEFSIGSMYLLDNSATTNSFSNERAVAISCLQNTIFGDDVNFLFSKFFFVSNIVTDSLISIEMDFGNGEGFSNIVFNDLHKVIVHYSQPSGYIELIGRLTYMNTANQTISVVYSHSTVYRKGTGTVPLPDNSTCMRAMSSIVLPADDSSYYPKPVWELVTITIPVGNGHYTEITHWQNMVSSSLFYSILYSPQNTDKNKLRRPFIICEGFDPGNKRDYYQKIVEDPNEDLPRDNDTRGLFELLNGDPSPWYNDKPKIDLIERIRKDGFDLVFINFTDGTGDINYNAGTDGLRGFLNDVINGSQYRDEKTEEAVLVGASMGGIITRHALASMEEAGEEHFVKMWFSFDSPQEGAYIPLGLQHAINYLSDIPCYGLSPLKSAREQFRHGKEVVNTAAAKQMLLFHYASTNGEGKPDPSQVVLYNYLRLLGINSNGYPIYSKNFAISNGGKTKLYETNHEQILDIKANKYSAVCAILTGCLTNPYWFHARAWGNNNDNNPSMLFDGSYSSCSIPYLLPTNNQIGFENAPGGWNALLYTLNCSPENAHHIDDDQDKVRTRATFMVTASAFGIPVTKDNVYLDWTKYTDCNDNTTGLIKTKFDEIAGQIENEEHVTISEATGLYLQDKLEKEFDESQRPRIRDGNAINQQVKGLVAYTAKDDLKFGGNNNNFSFENGSKSHITAGNTIQWLTGFSAKSGSNISAKIQPIEYSTVLKSNKVFEPLFDYKPSVYAWQKHDYSTKKATLFPEESGISIFPNPTNDKVTITLINPLHTQVIISVYNTKGQLVHKAISNEENRYIG